MAVNNFTNAAGGAWNTNGNWSLGHAPLVTEDVTISATVAGNVTLTTTAAVCRSLDFTGFTKNFSMSVGVTIGDGTAGTGNLALKLVSTMTWTRTGGGLTLASTSATTQTIDFGTVNMGVTAITVNGASSSYTLTGYSSASNTGAWTLGGSTTLQLTGTFLTTGAFAAPTCTFDINGQSFTASGFSSGSGTRVYKNTAGGGSMNLSGAYNVTSTTITCAWGTATLNCAGAITHSQSSGTATSFFSTVNATGASAVVTFAAAGFGATTLFTSTTIVMSGDSATFTGATSAAIAYTGLILNMTGTGAATLTNGVTIPTLSRTCSTAGCSLVLPTNRTMTISGTATITGSTTVMMLVTSGIIGTAATFSVGTAAFTHVTWQDVTGAGTASPFTGTDMGNLLGCTNVTFDSNRSLFWVGGTGNWSDSAHWSLTTGGSGGQVAPRQQDTVTFDSNSFSAGSQTVSMDRAYTCTTWNITTPTNSPTFAMNLGTLTFTGGWTHTGTFLTSGGLTQSITVASRTSATFSGSANSGQMGQFNNFASTGATWTFSGTLNLSAISFSAILASTINFGSSTIITNGVFTVGGASSSSTINFGTSSISVGTGGLAFGNNWTVSANTSVFHMKASSGTNVIQGLTGGTMPGLSIEGTGTAVYQFGSLGTWSSSDPLTLVSGTLTASSLTGTTSCSAFSVQGGILNVSVHALVCTSFSITGGTITNSFTGITVNPVANTTIATNGAALSVMTVNPAAGAAIAFTGAFSTVGALTINGQTAAGVTVSFDSGFTIGTDWITDKAVAYTMHVGSTYKVGNGGTSGTVTHTSGGATSRLTMVSSTPTSGYTNEMDFVAASMDYVDITDSTATVKLGSVGANSTLTRTVGWNFASQTASTSDVASGTDVASRVAAVLKSITDAALGTDSVSKTSSFLRSGTDSAPAVDSPTSISAKSRAITDAAAGTDVATRTTTVSKTVSDSAPASDSASKTTSGTRSGSDSAPASDSASRTLGPFSRAMSDVASGIDSIARLLQTARSATDAANGSDVVTDFKSKLRSATDAANGSDSPSVRIAKTAAISDAGSGVDSVSRSVQIPRFLVDVSGGTDVATTTRGANRSATDAANGSDSVNIRISKFAAVSDVANGQDAPSSTVRFHASVTDAAHGTDTVAISRGSFRFTVDSAPATDVAHAFQTSPGCISLLIEWPTADLGVLTASSSMEVIPC